MKKLVIVLVIVLVIAAGIGGLYLGRHTEKKATQVPAPTPTTQTEDKNVDTHEQKAFQVTQLGLQITLPDTLQDMTYVIKTNKLNDQSYQTAYFSTKTLTDKSPDCAADQIAPLGAVSKLSGQYPADAAVDNTAGTLLRQFPDFYLTYSSPQATCSDKKEDQDLQISQKQLFRNALSTIQQTQ